MLREKRGASKQNLLHARMNDQFYSRSASESEERGSGQKGGEAEIEKGFPPQSLWIEDARTEDWLLEGWLPD